MARQWSAKPCTAVRIRSRPQHIETPSRLRDGVFLFEDRRKRVFGDDDSQSSSSVDQWQFAKPASMQDNQSRENADSGSTEDDASEGVIYCRHCVDEDDDDDDSVSYFLDWRKFAGLS